MKKCLHLPTVNTFSGCSVKSAWQTRFQMLQKCLLANVDYNLPGCSVKTVLTCQPLQILWLYLAGRIISCISEHVLYIYLTAGKKCLADWVIHDIITRKMWLLKNDIFENPSLSVQTHLINKCTVLLHLTYSQGLLGLKIMYLIPENHKKNHWYTIHCWFITIYTVLLQSMLFRCTLCCFIAICVAL